MVGTKRVRHVARQKVTLRTTRDFVIAKLKKEMEYILQRNRLLVDCVVKAMSEKRSLIEQRDALCEEIVVNKMKYTEKLKEIIDEFSKQKEVFNKSCNNFISGLFNQMNNLNDTLKSSKTVDSGEGSLDSSSSKHENKESSRIQLTEEWRLESRLKSFRNIHHHFNELNHLSDIDEEADYKTPENTANKKYPGSAKKFTDVFDLTKSVTPRTPSIFNFEPVACNQEYSFIESPANIAQLSFESIESETTNFSVNQRLSRRRRTTLVTSPIANQPAPVVNRRSSIFNCRDPKKVRLSYTSHNLSFQVFSPRDRRVTRRQSSIAPEDINQPKTLKGKKAIVRELVKEDVYQFGDENCLKSDENTESKKPKRNTTRKPKKKKELTKMPESSASDSDCPYLRSPSISEFTPQVVSKGYIMQQSEESKSIPRQGRRPALHQIQSTQGIDEDENPAPLKRSMRKRMPQKKYNV